MSYVPKYTSIADVKSAVYPDAEKLADSYILDAIEEGEQETDEWLISCDFDPDNLDSAELEGAKGLALCYSVLRVIPKLPITVDAMREYSDEWRKKLEERAHLFIMSQYKKSTWKAQHRRIMPGYGREWGDAD